MVHIPGGSDRYRTHTLKMENGVMAPKPFRDWRYVGPHDAILGAQPPFPRRSRLGRRFPCHSSLVVTKLPWMDAYSRGESTSDSREFLLRTWNTIADSEHRRELSGVF